MFDSISQSLVVIENNVPLADSRIVAEKLDIQHGPFMTNTVLKYQGQVEAKCGIIHFENGEIKGRGRPERYARLTELQTNAYLGLVKNTPQSVELKIDLAVAFDEAKRIIANSQVQVTNNQPQDVFETLRDAKLLRSTIEDLEDKALSLKKTLQFLKTGEEMLFPSQMHTRGKRKAPPVKLFRTKSGEVVEQMLLLFA